MATPKTINKTVRSSWEQFAKTAKNPDLTPAELYHACFLHAHTCAKAADSKTSDRGLMARYSKPVVLGADEPEWAPALNLAGLYELAAKKAQRIGHPEFQDDDALDAKMAINCAIADGLLHRTYRGFVGLPDSFSGGGSAEKAKPEPF